MPELPPDAVILGTGNSGFNFSRIPTAAVRTIKSEIFALSLDSMYA
jgi:hypothetical protein